MLNKQFNQPSVVVSDYVLSKPKTFYLSSQIQTQITNTNIKNKSIFLNETSDYIDHNKGPQYDKFGKVIQRSIVGKPDDFMKVQRKQSQISSMKGSSPLHMKQSFLTMKQSSINFNISLFSKKVSTPRNFSRQIHHKTKDSVKIDSNEICEYLQQSRFRIKLNENNRIQKENSLPLIERHQVSRERRVIKHFEEQQDNWESMGDKLSRQCEREKAQTLFFRSQDFRLRKEFVNQVPDPISQTFWQDNLRQSTPEKPTETEFIRREIKDSDTRCVRTSGSLYSEKFKKLVFNKIKQNQHEIGFMRVEGENKLNSELKEVKDIYVDPKQSNQAEKEQELDISDWNLRTASKSCGYKTAYYLKKCI